MVSAIPFKLDQVDSMSSQKKKEKEKEDLIVALFVLASAVFRDADFAGARRRRIRLGQRTRPANQWFN